MAGREVYASPDLRYVNSMTGCRSRNNGYLGRQRVSDHVPLIVDLDVPIRRDQTLSKPGKALRTDLEG